MKEDTRTTSPGRAPPEKGHGRDGPANPNDLERREKRVVFDKDHKNSGK